MENDEFYNARTQIDEIDGNDLDKIFVATPTGVHVFNVSDVLAVATGDGTLVILTYTGVQHLFNTEHIESLHCPFKLYLHGPTGGNELLAVWNEYRQTQTREAPAAWNEYRQTREAL